MRGGLGQPGPPFFPPREPILPTLSAGQFFREDEGLSSIEFALLASLIAVFCALAVTAVGTNTLSLYMMLCNAAAVATGNPPC